MRIPAGPWHPDKPGFQNPGLVVARNCIADLGFYRPWRGFASINENTLAADPRGMFVFRRGSDDWVLIYGGGTKLYEINSRVTAPVDRSRDGGDYLMQPGDRWRGLQFGSDIVLTNYRDNIQTMNAAAPTAFADLGGTDTDSAEFPPRAKYLAAVRNRVVLAYTNDPVDGEMSTRIWWHGFTNGLPDLESWQPSLATGADFQTIPDLGPITGITGGEFGTILCEDGIARMTSGGPAVFQIENVSADVGCVLPGSVVRYGRFTYFYARQGWHVFDGQSATAIGHSKVDRWFARDMDFDQADRMWAAASGNDDGVLVWLYPGAGNTGRPNRMLIFSTNNGEWTTADADFDILAPTVTFGGDLDDETDERWDDLDTFEGDLDDPSLWSRFLRLGAVRNGELLAQVGGTVPAVFQSPEFEMAPGYRSMLRQATTVRNSGGSIVEVGARQPPAGTPQWTNGYTEQADGVVRCREFGRYHSVRSTLTDWTDFQGWDVEGVRAGRR